MPTDVISKIGASNSPTTMDYSTLQAWEDACPADLTTAGERYIGECYDQGEFVLTTNPGFTISGETVDATHNIILRCATGASFKDKTGVRTTALAYNASNGVAIRSTSGSYNTVFSGAPNYTEFHGLQISGSSVSTNLINIIPANGVMTNCIIRGQFNNGNCIGMGANATLINNLIYGMRAAVSLNSYSSVTCRIENNTCIASTNSVGCFGINNSFHPILINNAVFGYGSFSDAGGTADASSDYNATNNASAAGSHSLTSLTFASQFVSTTTDFRAVDTGSLKAGTPDSTNAPTDITGLTRDATTPYIGCWEVSGGAAASPFNGAVFENPNPKRVVKDKSYNSPFPINLYGKDTFFGAPGQAPEYTLDKPTKLRSNSRLNYEINTNLGLYFPVTPFIVYEDTRPRRRKTNTLNFESNLDLDLITISVIPFVAYDVDRKLLRRNRNLDWISNTDINLFSIANPFLVTEVTIPRRLLRQFRDFNAPINLNLLGKDTFFGAPGQAPLFDLKNPNTHRSNARLSFEVPITLFNRIPPTPVDDTTALLLFANLHIRLDVKREMDSGNVDALASDIGGTPVTFNKAFLDVDSITLTVAATQPITAIYDFVDVPNPTGFTVYAYDSSGNRVNFTVSWKARGIV